MESDLSQSSVTQWIAKLDIDEPGEAQAELWNRYFSRLVGLARKKLGTSPKGEADEEDVAAEALTSFFAAAADNKFAELNDRNNLWPVLAKITANKAISQQRRQLAQKRGSGNVRGDSVLLPTESGKIAWPDALAECDLDPAFLASMSEECAKLFEQLEDDGLREIARCKLEGYTNAELAGKLEVAERTIERRIALIRTIWNEVVA